MQEGIHEEGRKIQEKGRSGNGHAGVNVSPYDLCVRRGGLCVTFALITKSKQEQNRENAGRMQENARKGRSGNGKDQNEFI